VNFKGALKSDWSVSHIMAGPKISTLKVDTEQVFEIFDHDVADYP
jgi:hypothetical protein